MELLVLFMGVPLVFAVRPGALPRIPALLLFTLYCIALLLRDPSFERKRLLSTGNISVRLKPILLRLVPVALLLGGITLAVSPGTLLDFPRHRPGLWILIMFFYPVLSAYPQEIIYRAFFFHRYRPVFSSEKSLVVASTVVFGFMHIVFGNPVAVLLTLIGGYMFARTYAKTGSLIVVTIEHSLYGCVIFTVGLGHYFYIAM
jgi:membrane protease YdiL (CAAX protease family)